MPAPAKPPKNIVIVGGGSAGWMTATAFLRTLGQAGSKITLIESGNIPTIGVGEGTTPLFKRFLNLSHIGEAEFMSACKATYKLGINFPGWTGNKEFDSYFHPFAAPGYREYEQQFFANCDLRRAGSAANTDPSDFFFNAKLAQERKAPVGPGDPGKIDYAYHFDTSYVAEFFKKRCLDQGVNYVVDDVKEVVQKNDGDIDCLVTAGSGTLAGDFYVDCTGFRRMVIGKLTAKQEFLSYQLRLFNDSAVVIRTAVPEEGDFPPFTESTALKNGWAWRIPLVNKTSWGYVYSADYTTREDAEAELRSHIGDAAQDRSPLHIRLQVGRMSGHWKKNCVAIGLSQGFIEPLEATALGLTQFSINRFITHFMRGGFEPVYREHFNSIINEAFDCTIDYIQMHYKLNTRDDTQYWRDCRANENITRTMRAVLAGWDSSAADFLAVLKENVHRSSYAPYSWYCILSGMGRYAEETSGRHPRSNPYDVSRYPGHRPYLDSLKKI
ncbi:MAG: tryptophan halogenase family protein [Woeseia sp.]